MDWVQSSVANLLAVVDAPLYDLGVLIPRGMLPGLNNIAGTAVLEQLSGLKRHNHNGAHIYFRPSGEHRFTVLDDLDQPALRTARRVILVGAKGAGTQLRRWSLGPSPSPRTHPTSPARVVD